MAMRRKLFNEVLDAEERKRLFFLEDAVAYKFEFYGFQEISRLVRLVEPLGLRKQLLDLLRSWNRRVPSTLEVVCNFCRRKITKKSEFARNVPGAPWASHSSDNGKFDMTDPSPEGTLLRTQDKTASLSLLSSASREESHDQLDATRQLRPRTAGARVGRLSGGRFPGTRLPRATSAPRVR